MHSPRAFSRIVLGLCVLLLAGALAGQAAPAAPTLISPAHRAAGVATNGELRWAAVRGAKDYQVRFAYTRESIQSVRYAYTYYRFALLRYDTCYHWQVRAFDEHGVAGPWSATRNFTTTATVPPNTPATAPTLTAPLQNAGQVETSPTLTWTPIPGATNYSIHISVDPDLGNPGNRDGYFVQGYVAGPSWKVPALFGNTRYYWRVNGTINGRPGPASDIGSFTTRASTETKPPNPVLLSPAEGEIGLPLTLKARWQGQQAAYYLLEYATKEESLKNGWWYCGSQVATEYPFIKLKPNTCYLWRVRSMNSAGASAWTTGSFTTGTK